LALSACSTARGIEPIRWDRIHDGDPARVVDLRYRPTR
jgi:hypothetical protein